MQQAHKLVWADNLRVLATISVICLHVAAPILYQFGYVSTFVWWTGNGYDSITRFCVPVFVMLTGTLLLRKEEKLSSFFRKRLLRVIVPFLFWSLVYITFNLVVTNMSFGSHLDFPTTVTWVFEQLKRGSSYHLWYVYMIIGIYLLIPVVGKWIRASTAKEIHYFLIIWLLTIVLAISPFDPFSFYIDLSFFAGFIGYLVLGYYLSLYPVDANKILNKLAIPLIITGSVITAFGTYYLSNSKNTFVEDLYGSFTLNVVATSSGIFLLFKRVTITQPVIVKVRDVISKYSFGIYLAHVLILTLLEAGGIYWNLLHPLIGIPITTIICLIISATIVHLIHQLPFGKYISG